jgi:antitoxin FitA
MESEARRILDDAVRPADRPRLGDMLLGLFQPLGGIELKIERDRTPHTPIQFDK